MKFSNLSKVFYSVAIISLSSSAYAVEPVTTFYGEIDLSIAQTKTEDPSMESLVVNSGSMETSYIGVKSSVDLGDGLTGLITLESFLQADVGDSGRGTWDTFYARSAYVGLQGGFGTVTMGRNTTPYFISVILTNPLVAAFGYSPAIMHSFLGGLAGDSGWSNSVSYSMPSMNGFDVSLLYSAGEVADEKGVDKVGGNIFYRAGDFTGTIAYQTVDPLADDGVSPVDDTQTATLIGATYDLGVVKLFGQYQTMTDDYASADIDYKTYQLGVSIPFDMSAVLISYANTDVTGDADYDRKTTTVAYNYYISDKVTLYAAGYSDDFSDVGGTATNIGLGGRFKF